MNSWPASYPRAACTRTIGEVSRLLGRPSCCTRCTGHRGTRGLPRRTAAKSKKTFNENTRGGITQFPISAKVVKSNYLMRLKISWPTIENSPRPICARNSNNESFFPILILIVEDFATREMFENANYPAFNCRRR